jgi:hypothetical protein
MRLLALSLFLGACETLALLPPIDAGVDAMGGDSAVSGEGSGQRPGAGKLEPGFYQRQCMWDACNPPPENKPEPEGRPVE